MQWPINSNRVMVFSVFFVLRCYKEESQPVRVDSWRNKLVVRQLPPGRNVSREADDIVGIRNQTTTGEDKAG